MIYFYLRYYIKLLRYKPHNFSADIM